VTEPANGTLLRPPDRLQLVEPSGDLVSREQALLDEQLEQSGQLQLETTILVLQEADPSILRQIPRRPDAALPILQIRDAHALYQPHQE
jgi:hypothetical protein